MTETGEENILKMEKKCMRLLSSGCYFVNRKWKKKTQFEKKEPNFFMLLVGYNVWKKYLSDIDLLNKREKREK